MQPRGILRLALLAMIASLLMVPVAGVGAQADGADAQTRAQLAAIPLSTAALPDGYILAGEGFSDAGQTGADQNALVDAGFLGMYVSTYQQEDAAGTITSYVSVWSDANAAANGFSLLEDESVTAPDTDLSDQELDAGDGPAELTTGTVEVDGVSLMLQDATFVVDRFVVGVSVERPADNALGNDAMAALVDSLQNRATTVASGQAPDGIDLSLATSSLDITTLGAGLQTGFLSAAEAEALYGVRGSSLGSLQSSWVSLAAAGENGSVPLVTLGLSAFADADTAARVVEQSADLVPLTIELQAVDGFSADGVDSARAYRFVSPATDAGEPDSFRVVAQSGQQVIVIDVQGVGSGQAARTAATDLLAAQLACSDGPCQVPELNPGA